MVNFFVSFRRIPANFDIRRLYIYILVYAFKSENATNVFVRLNVIVFVLEIGRIIDAHTVQKIIMKRFYIGQRRVE